MDKTSVDIFRDFLTTVWAPLLEPMGFRGKGFDYHRDRGPYRDVIKVEPDAKGSAVRVYLGVHSRLVLTSGDYADASQAAVGSLIASRYLALPGCVESFWVIKPAGPVNLQIIVNNLHALFLNEGKTYFDEVSTLRAPASRILREPGAVIR